MPLSKEAQERIDAIAKTLAKTINEETFIQRYGSTVKILTLVGAGVFVAASAMVPGLPMALKPFLKRENEYQLWKRFNIGYLKRTLERLEKQRLVEIGEEENQQVVKITDRGRRRILKYALSRMAIGKPRFWDGKWRLVSYDIPTRLSILRDLFRQYLLRWGFYKLHESVFLHAYPCEREIEFLREYLGIGKYVRIMTVMKIENDAVFREFYGI